MFPKQLNKLKIRSKLVFFLVIPIITLLYFSISSIHLKYQEHARTQASLDFILVSLSLSELVHELQKERGLSAGFVGSAGTLHKKALLEQRKSTDEKLTLFTQHLTTHDPDHASWNLRTLFSHLQKKLKQLISIRTEIDAFKKNDFFYKYSAINTMALDICMHLQTLINDIDLAKQNDAYTTLLWLQERSGQERGLLNGIFSAKKINANQFKDFSGYISQQETLISHFFTVASSKQQTLLRNKFKHPVLDEVKEFQTAVINKTEKNDLLNNLQILIGYGGLIHNFKNHVIRGDEQYQEHFNQLFISASKIIDKYRKLPGMSKIEIDSLNTIHSTFLKYQEFLTTTANLRAKESNIDKIDSFVKINDKPALKAIEFLHKTITGLDTKTWWDKATLRIQLIKDVSDTIRNDMLKQAKNIISSTSQSLNLYIILTFLSLIVSGIFGYLIMHHLLEGIINLASHMKQMVQKDDFNKTIDINSYDEINHVAKAFNKLINERKKSEDKLALAANVLNNTNEAIVVTDSKKNICMINPAFTKITGYEQNEVIGKNPSLLQSGKHEKQFYKTMWATLLQHGHWIGEIYNQRKNGEIYPELLNISVIKNDQGEIIMYIGMFLDITKRKLAEEKHNILQQQLLQAQKMESLGQLTGGIAHDFNNMLATILGYTDLATEHIENNKNNEQLQSYLDQVTQAGNRAKHVVTQLLAFSRTGQDTSLQSLDLETLLHESIKMIRPLISSTITLTTHINTNITTIQSNPVKLHQIILNLCINACDSIDAHGQIDFTINTIITDTATCSSCHKLLNGEYLELSISDTGTGIDQINIDKVFDPFFTTKKMGNEKGTGMGLSIVHGIMHEHDGHIILESKSGKGSKFRLMFPLTKDLNTNHITPNFAGDHTDERSDHSIEKNLIRKILCVDDEQSLVLMMKEMLENHNYRVTAFTDSEDALSHFNDHLGEYDLIITDQTMPQLTGLEMAKIMLTSQADIKIILCSGYSDQIDKNGAEAIGIKAYMKKPLNMQSLLKKINQLETGIHD